MSNLDNLDDDVETGLLSGADLDVLDSIGAVEVMEGTSATSPNVGSASQPVSSGKVVTETGSFSPAVQSNAKPPSAGGTGPAGNANGSNAGPSSSLPSSNHVPRNTVQAIQRRRAQQAAAARRGRQDRLSFYCLIVSMGWAALWFLYAVSTGSLQTLRDKEDTAGFIGQGLLQVVRLKSAIFYRIPCWTLAVGFVWLRLLWWRPKLLIWLTLLGNGLLLFSVFTSLLFHGNHYQSESVTALGALGLVCTVVWTCSNCIGMTMEDVELVGAMIKEGAWWLRSPVPPEAKTAGRLGAFDKLPLVTFALLVLSLFLTSAAVAGSVHLWAITKTVASGSGSAQMEAKGRSFFIHKELFIGDDAQNMLWDLLGPNVVEEMYTQQLLKDASDPDALYNYGRFLWLVKSDADAAEKAIAQVLEMDPEDKGALELAAHIKAGTKP